MQKNTIDRRSILRGLFAAPAVIAAANLMPISVKLIAPKIWGDGIHDDAAAIQWLLDNEKHVDLRGALCRISRPLVLPPSTRISNVSLKLDETAYAAIVMPQPRDEFPCRNTFVFPDEIVSGLL